MARPDTMLPIRSPQPDVEVLYHKVTFGASSAVASQSSNSGVTVSKSATGRWSAVIEAPAQELLFLGFCPQTTNDARDFNFHVYTAFAVSTRTVVFSNSPAGSETDPTADDSVLLMFYVKPTDTGFSL